MACHSAGADKLVGPGLAGVMTTAGPTHTDPVNYGGNLPNGQPRTAAALLAASRHVRRDDARLASRTDASRAGVARRLSGQGLPAQRWPAQVRRPADALRRRAGAYFARS
jgi:hypothetical protein